MIYNYPLPPRTEAPAIMSSSSSSSSSSPEMDEAKQKAKRNILQFVTAQGSSFPIPGGASSNLTPTPPLRRNVSADSPPVPLVRRDVGGGANPSTPRDLSADDVARHTKLKVQEIVRTLQDSSLAQPPVPKPRKSPCTSPNRSAKPVFIVLCVLDVLISATC